MVDHYKLKVQRRLRKLARKKAKKSPRRSSRGQSAELRAFAEARALCKRMKEAGMVFSRGEWIPKSQAGKPGVKDDEDILREELAATPLHPLATAKVTPWG